MEYLELLIESHVQASKDRAAVKARAQAIHSVQDLNLGEEMLHEAVAAYLEISRSPSVSGFIRYAKNNYGAKR